MKKLVVDLDDVLALHSYLKMLNAFAGTNYRYEDLTDYYVEKMLPLDRRIRYKEYFKNNNVYDYAEVAPDSRKVLKELMSEYDIYVCSSYYSGIDKDITPELLEKKCNYLKQNFEFIPSQNYIFINDKSLIEADVKIDDRIENLKNAKTKLLFTTYLNRNDSKPDVIRVNNWKDVEKQLIKKPIYKK